MIVDTDEKRGLSRRISDWHKKYLSSNDHARDPGRKIDFDHGSDRDHLPLQAADVLVNETYRYMRNKYQDAETAKMLVPFLGATPIGTTDEHAEFRQSFRQSLLDGVEERVDRRHALLGPLRQAIPAGAALLVRDVNRFGWPALHRFHLDRLALHRPVL